MHEIYAELDPKKRIATVIHEFIYPALERSGFEFIPSVGTLKRSQNDLVHEIDFPRHKRNKTGISYGFDVSVTVRSPRLNKWYKKTYGMNLVNSIIASHTNDYIPGFDKKEFELGLNLSFYENQRVIDSLKANILDAALPYLDQYSNYVETVSQVMSEGYLFKAPMLMDICEIIGNTDKSHEVLNWFNAAKDNGIDFKETTLADIEIRKARLRSGITLRSRGTPVGAP